MAKTISVILLEDVAGSGRAGDIVEVAEGYARNQLFPAGQAALAESPTGKQAQKKQADTKQAQAQELKRLRSLAEKLDGTELTITARAKEDGGIFGSIAAKQVAEELSRQVGESFAARQVRLPKPIRALGTTAAVVSLAADAEFEIHVTVVSNEKA